MASLRIARSKLSEVSSDALYKVGARFIMPATSNKGEKEYMYIKYNAGAGALSCNTNTVLVPYYVAGTAGYGVTTYTGDKTALARVSVGRYAGIAKGNFTYAKTGYYGFMQIKGETIIANGGSASIKTGQALYAGSPGGTDKIAYPLLNYLTYTTLGKIQMSAIFAHAVRGSATWTTHNLYVNLIGW